MKAWHFAGESLRGGQPLPQRGETLVHDGPVVICQSGYHGSVRAIDALKYAPGTMVARVEIEGDISQQNDKLCGRRRTGLTDYRDSREILTKLARIWALRALRIHAAGTLRAAGLTKQADKLAALTDDCELVAAGKAADTAADDAGYAGYAARAAWAAAGYAGAAARYAGYAARYAGAAGAAGAALAAADAAGAAGAAAERDQQNAELEAELKKLLA